MDKLWFIFFLPPENFKASSQSAWYTNHLHGINWSSGDENEFEYEKKGKIKTSRNGFFFANGFEKTYSVRNFGNKGYNFGWLRMSKIRNLIFKSEEYGWRCSNYPFRHAILLHCAERKAFAYHTEHGLDVFLLNCISYKSFCTILCFWKIKFNHHQCFHSKIEMGDYCDKQLN